VICLLETKQSKWDALSECLQIDSDDLLKQKSNVVFDYDGTTYLVFDIVNSDSDNGRFLKELKKSIRKFFSKYKDDAINLGYVADSLDIEVREIKECFLAEVLIGEMEDFIPIPLIYDFLIKKQMFNKFVDEYMCQMMQNQFRGNGWVLGAEHGGTLLSDSWEYQDGYIIFNKDNIDYD
jgi:hypothetical protein